MDDLLQEFLTETNESLATLDSELVRFERESSDARILGNIFRLMHTIKGTCGFLGLPRLEAVAHAGENVLGKFRDGELEVTPGAVTLILRAIDRIREILVVLEETGAEPAGDDSVLIAQVNAVASADDAISADAVTIDDEGFPVAAELLAEVAQAIGQDASLGIAIVAPKPVTEAAAEPREDAPVAAAASSIRVNVDVIENLMTLISELVLTRNQLLQLQRVQKGNEFKVPLQRLSHITSDLQDGVTRMRMQPIGNAWAKLPRIVRDLAVETKKRIELVMQGAETELDRQVLEIIKDPLTHMVRNSADHGIESAAARLAAGKPETGTITLKAYHESGHIFIRISDDGRGLNVEGIRRKALSNGLVTESELASLSEQQILQFIFRPGFSTAEKVTSVSGRGVGMDVVRTNIERIGGMIEMTSVAGQGSTFLIKIPLTLAIVSALIVEAASQRFAIPQINVIELVGVSDRSEMSIQTINNAPVLRLRDRLLPLVSLRGLLHLGEAEPGRTDYVVVAEVGAAKFGIIVDRVFDTEEIVVKPVSPILRGTPFYAGNTILGDGSVILILDPNGIATAAKQNAADESTAADPQASAHESKDETAFLLFRARGEELKAVPLELVARLEDIDAASIEHVGGRHVVQYREHLMPLVPFDDAHAWPASGKQAVLVFSDHGRSMGLAVDAVVDIVRDRMAIELSSERLGLLGSAIIAGKATDIVNIGHFLTQAFADWFDGQDIAARAVTALRRALVVDDSAFFRNLIVPQLRAAKWHVTSAADGTEALSLMETDRPFDIVISDIEMPRMGGLDFAAAVRRDQRWQSVPMIALSSHANANDIAQGRAAGFDDYLSKADQPHLPQNLARAMETATQGRAANGRAAS
ncbi:MAG TPA: chemotaxis protein CheW [Rhizomicrobium sp.]|nr:chemotaxis protein CheW [Rhizomicrobium sp.]